MDPLPPFDLHVGMERGGIRFMGMLHVLAKGGRKRREELSLGKLPIHRGRKAPFWLPSLSTLVACWVPVKDAVGRRNNFPGGFGKEEREEEIFQLSVSLCRFDFSLSLLKTLLCFTRNYYVELLWYLLYPLIV